ncbi:MAG: histidine kinase dimerization/phospho-acceptor domain-containing protein [Gemmatimonadaceae bacterium]
MRRRLIAEAGVVIGQRVQLERRLEEQTTLAAELRRTNEELEGFSYSVAHDLRAPLRSVNGFAQILAEDYGDKLDAEGRQLLQRIHVNTIRAGTLIDGLLALARLRRGDVRSEWVDLAAIARTVVEDLRRAAPDRPVDVRIADRLVTRGDPRLLAVVMQNLLGNAWKFTREQPRPVIEVAATRERGGRDP